MKAMVVAGGGDIRDAVEAFPAGATTPEAIAAELLPRVQARRARPDSLWFDAVVDWNQGLGAHPGLLARAGRLAREGGAVVLAGQQVGLFGGPLYTLYKLLSASRLASWLEARSGVPVVPVFWLVGDDSDFGEVASIAFPDGLGRPQRLRDPDSPVGGTLIGRMPAQRHLGPLAEFRDLLTAWPHGAWVVERIEAALRLSHTWSDLHAALYHQVLGEHGALFVDGGADPVLRAAGPWLAEAADAPLGALLEEGAARLAGAVGPSEGGSPPLDPGLGERALFRIADGRRESLAAGSPARGVLAAGDLLAPNVVLRPVLQDHLLPNVATICGPSEIRYRRQLGPVYARLGVPEPIRPARFAAALLPPLPGLGTLRRSAALLAARDPAAFVEAQVAEALPGELLEALSGLREHVRDELQRLDPALAAYDRSLPQLVSSAAGKADYQFERMLEGVRGKARHQLFQREPLLAALGDFVLPRERPQERTLSFWLPLASEGEGAVGALAAAAGDHVLHAALTALRGDDAARGEDGADGGDMAPAVFQLEGPPLRPGGRPGPDHS